MFRHIKRFKRYTFAKVSKKLKDSKSLRTAKSPESHHKRVLLMYKLTSLFLATSVVGALMIIIVFTYFSSRLPSPSELVDRPVDQSTKIYDKNGILLYDVYGTKNRTLVTLDNVSPYLLKATLATEDADFYKHRGFDVFSYVRAGVNMVLGKGLQGGSTITQQLVKNSLLSSERTIIRKIKEFVLTLQIETRYKKSEIIQMYLNEAPYGSTAWGVESASELYFGKKAKDLNLAESALIAGLPQSPTNYSPFTNPDNARNRQKYVLKLMKEKGWLNEHGKREYLTDQEYQDALSLELVFSSAKNILKAPHFVMYVRDRLISTFGEDLVEKGGLKVFTTLDFAFNEQVQKEITEGVAKQKELKVGNGSAVVLDTKTGAILSMVGSKDFYNEEEDGQVNVALSQRQPGSSIKPITYATALKMGYTASTNLFDIQTVFPGGIGQKDYIPKNYDGKFRGPVQMRYALAQSLNIPAVKTLKLVGIKNMIQTANDMGIASLTYDPNRYGLSLTLGGGEVKLIEMANAFSVFGNKGVYNPYYAIEKVEDNKGKVIYSHQVESKQALDPGISYIIYTILSDENARAPMFGYRSFLYIPNHSVGAKTGTTDDKRDNWTIGFSGQVTTAVWIGNNDNSPMSSYLESGVSGAAPIWSKIMNAYLSDKDDEKFEKPENVIQVSVGKLTGMVPSEDIEESRTEYFIKGTEPKGYSPWIVELEICEEDDKLANDDCRKDDKTDFKTFIKFTDHLEEWQSVVDEWVLENYDDEKYFPPDEVTDYKSD